MKYDPRQWRLRLELFAAAERRHALERQQANALRAVRAFRGVADPQARRNLLRRELNTVTRLAPPLEIACWSERFAKRDFWRAMGGGV